MYTNMHIHARALHAIMCQRTIAAKKDTNIYKHSYIHLCINKFAYIHQHLRIHHTIICQRTVAVKNDPNHWAQS